MTQVRYMSGGITRYTFEEVRYPARKRVKCANCGKALVRSQTFTATVNPWNKNADGTKRTRAEIVEVLRAKASAWIAEPATCTKPCVPETRYRVIEVDNMTGNERDLDNMDEDPWSRTFTRTQADATVAWREQNIVSRYSYRVVETPR